MNTTHKAKLTVRIHGETLFIGVAGVATLGTMRQIRAATFRAAIQHDVGRALIDFSNAVLAMADVDWAAFSADSASRNAIRLSTALLVAEPFLDAAWDHCERLTDYGRVCLAFSHRPSAYRWASLDLHSGQQAEAASAGGTPPHRP